MTTEDVYVARCTRAFPSTAAGVAHERECPDCRREPARIERVERGAYCSDVYLTDGRKFHVALRAGYWDYPTVEEIANACGCTVEKVVLRLSRGRDL